MQLGLFGSLLVAGAFLTIIITTGSYFISDLNVHYDAQIANNLSVSQQNAETDNAVQNVSSSISKTSEAQPTSGSGLNYFLGSLNVMLTLPAIANANVSLMGSLAAEVSRILPIGWVFAILISLFASIVILYTAMFILNRGQIP